MEGIYVFSLRSGFKAFIRKSLPLPRGEQTCLSLPLCCPIGHHPRRESRQAKGWSVGTGRSTKESIGGELPRLGTDPGGWWWVSREESMDTVPKKRRALLLKLYQSA